MNESKIDLEQRVTFLMVENKLKDKKLKELEMHIRKLERMIQKVNQKR